MELPEVILCKIMSNKHFLVSLRYEACNSKNELLHIAKIPKSNQSNQKWLLGLLLLVIGNHYDYLITFFKLYFFLLKTYLLFSQHFNMFSVKEFKVILMITNY